jgi:hypothetical protein
MYNVHRAFLSIELSDLHNGQSVGDIARSVTMLNNASLTFQSSMRAGVSENQFRDMGVMKIFIFPELKVRSRLGG